MSGIVIQPYSFGVHKMAMRGVHDGEHKGGTAPGDMCGEAAALHKLHDQKQVGSVLYQGPTAYTRKMAQLPPK